MDSVRATGRRFGGWIRAASWVALGCGAGLPAIAQQTAPPPENVAPTAPVKTAEGVQAFDATYFRTYNPITAYDMVARVPGFEISDGEQLRGFGATAGNVLINGERPSSKTLISDQLKRVPAEEVARVELISGSASNVDVRGQTQLVNVVLKSFAHFIADNVRRRTSPHRIFQPAKLDDASDEDICTGNERRSHH